MNYESWSIIDAIGKLNKTIYLPAIQRGFVWDTVRVEKLFDSLMGDYPIGSFLFWKIDELHKDDWTSYEFIRDFDEDNPNNKEANLAGVNKDIYLVLDGQQRLSSLFIGLKGSYRYFHYKERKTKLFLNLLKEPKRNEDSPEELAYQFEFRESDKTDTPDKELWYEVGKIMNFEDSEYAKKDISGLVHSLEEERRNNANMLIGRLHTRIHTYKSINYYEEKSQDYDKVVEVFIRANTAGKPLGYSDILLSTATAKWKILNAREEIEQFTDSVNSIGNGYEFGKDFVLKGCLYLTQELEIQYKVKNFTKSNLEKIENNWSNIKKYLEDTVDLISKYGLANKNIIAPNALLPLAFYLLKLGKKNYIESSHIDDVRNQNIIQKWLILVLLKNVFGTSSDTILKRLRDVLLQQKSYGSFPFVELNKELAIEPKFNEAELEKLLLNEYKNKYCYSVLSLLYQGRDWKDKKYHEDHIFPKSEFTEAKLRARGYDGEKVKSYRKYYNTVANLQLLTDSENLDKRAQSFDKWLATRDANFKNRHSIPTLPSYNFDNFIKFIEERRKIVTDKLQTITL
ncbi:MAG: DUF262 domain-containing protein [Candidatus Omnitrophica bacterium]|nr:DUF262 domain-containing protein [Candidatus Omnitrophota bacterium]